MAKRRDQTPRPNVESRPTWTQALISDPEIAPDRADASVGGFFACVFGGAEGCSCALPASSFAATAGLFGAMFSCSATQNRHGIERTTKQYI